MNSNGKHEYLHRDRDQKNALTRRINVHVLNRKHTKVARDEVILCISETLGLQFLPYNTNDIVAQTRSYMLAPPDKRPKRTAPGIGEFAVTVIEFGNDLDKIFGQTGGVNYKGATKKRRRRR